MHFSSLILLEEKQSISPLLFSLVQVQNQSFGPKQNTKFTVDTHPPTHPKLFEEFLGLVEG